MNRWLCRCEHAAHDGKPCGAEPAEHTFGNGRYIRHQRCWPCEQTHPLPRKR